MGNNSPAPGRPPGHSYLITGSLTANSCICNVFTAVGYTDKARALQPSAPPSTGRARLSRVRRLLSLGGLNGSATKKRNRCRVHKNGPLPLLPSSPSAPPSAVTTLPRTPQVWAVCLPLVQARQWREAGARRFFLRGVPVMIQVGEGGLDDTVGGCLC